MALRKVELGERTVQELDAVFTRCWRPDTDPDGQRFVRPASWGAGVSQDEAHSAVFVSILMRGHTRKMMAEMMPAEALT